MIKAWLEMKRKEILVKCKVYSMILAFADEQEDFIRLVKDLYESLKGVSADELRKEFIAKLAEIIHRQAEKERKLEKETV